MKRILTVGMVTLVLFNLAFAQKQTTILGDSWSGEVVATNDSSREITIKYDEKGKTQTFVGVLTEGYKVKMTDGSSHELRVSEIQIGTRVTVFFKSKEQNLGGRKAKVNLISYIDFKGKDEFAKLREQLHVPASISITLAESKDLPAGNPLKVYLAIENQNVGEALAEWMSNWNKDKGTKFGKLEIVSSMTTADVYLARVRGSDLTIQVIPTATMFLVVPKNHGMEVIWRQVVGLDPFLDSSSGNLKEIDKAIIPFIQMELEKRMKARKK